MYDVEINQLDLMALFDLKGPRSQLEKWCDDALPAFPDAPLQVSLKDRVELISAGPDHWILRAPLEHEETLLAALKPGEAPDDISIVLISDTLAFFSVTGDEADEVMAVATPLDLHRDVFSDNAAAFSEVFSIKALILRTPAGYQFGVERSYAPMIADYLARTTAD